MLLEHLLYTGLGRGRDGTRHMAQTLVPQQRSRDSLIQGLGFRPPHLPGYSLRDGMPRNHCTGTETRARDIAGPPRAEHPVLRPHPCPARQRASLLRDWEGPRSGFVAAAVGSLSKSSTQAPIL